MKVINGENLVLGRLASYIAKQLLLGEEIALVNCEKILITGNKKTILAKKVQARERGHPRWGPFYYRRPDMFVKRAIRGMLPRKKPRGKEALKKIKCYCSIPKQFQEAKMETLENANIKKVPNLRYTSVKEICQIMGAKW